MRVEAAAKRSITGAPSLCLAAATQLFIFDSNTLMEAGGTAFRLIFCSFGAMMSLLLAEWGSTKTGEQEHLILTALNCVLRVPRYIPQEQRFDVRVLVRPR